ncbi:MAG: AAA family ATPase [Polyangiales bacterium]
MTEGFDSWWSGFASLRSVELWPGRMTVLIGPNGSGKSNVLRVFRLLEELRGGALQRFVGSSGGAAALLHYGPKKTKRLKVAVSFGSENQFDWYEAWMEFASGDRLQLVSESLAEAHDAANDAVRLEEPIRTGPWESVCRWRALTSTAKPWTRGSKACATTSTTPR